MMSILARQNLARRTSERHQRRIAAQVANAPLPVAAPIERANRGRKAAATRSTPYPTLFTMSVKKRDLANGHTLEEAALRGLREFKRTPSEVLVVGSMVGVARRTSPRGAEKEWFEYVATEPNKLRNFRYRLEKGLAVRTPAIFIMKFVQSYVR